MNSRTYKQAFKAQRNRYAAELRRQRRMLDSLCTCSHCEAGISKTSAKWPRIALGLAILSVLLLLGVRCAHAAETHWTDQQIVAAIGHAECGKNMDKCQYYYGIRSVHYDSKEEAKRICLRTVRHLRQRYYKTGHRTDTGLICFIGQIYCPTKGRDRSASEKRLNGNWAKNVRWFLNHPTTERG